MIFHSDAQFEFCRRKSPLYQWTTKATSTALRKVRLAAVLVGLALHVQAAQAADELNRLTPEQAAAGWISLFDGESLFGWTATTDANWKVENGAITVSEGEEGFLMTTSQFADYELHVEFKAPPSTNSGVFLRSAPQPTDPTTDCIELNIAPRDNPFPTGSVVGRARLTPSPRSHSSKDPIIDPWDGQWHSLDVVLGENMIVAIDGRRSGRALLTTKTDGSPAIVPSRGQIGLQFREGPVAFRNIRLKPGNLEPMLNGRDLAGWNDDEKRASEFQIVVPEQLNEQTAELHVTGGSGQLETDASYGDFTLQFDCRVDGDGLNSGVFFRCIPRQYMQGYECQISNKPAESDPTQPADFGTGAIYRRVAARRLVVKDREWFTTTVNAVGPHIAVWVNGYQVTDWTDARPPDENPRAGLRTAPGTIAIQGHDPTTDLRFRNFRIRELPGRQNDQ